MRAGQTERRSRRSSRYAKAASAASSRATRIERGGSSAVASRATSKIGAPSVGAPARKTVVGAGHGSSGTGASLLHGEAAAGFTGGHEEACVAEASDDVREEAAEDAAEGFFGGAGLADGARQEREAMTGRVFEGDMGAFVAEGFNI